MKIKYRYVFNRTKRLNKMRQGLIQIEAYKLGKKAYFSTHIYVREEQFDGMIVQHPHAADLNAMLTDMILKLESIELDLWKHGIEPTLDHLRQGWRESHKLTDFIWFAAQTVAASSRKDSTKQNLFQTISKLAKFRRCSVAEIDYLYLRGFEEWLRGQNISRNTIQKEMSNFRALISEAIRAGLLKENPFDRYQMPRTEKKQHVVLTEDEIARIAKCPINTNVRDAFLFCCKTGMRYSDYVRLSEANFKVIQGREWLVFCTVKTHTTVYFPYYLVGPLPYPAISNNAVVNRQLQKICSQAGITKSVTFHTSRHTFATRMLSLGIPITTVQQMLGHSSVKMTERYAETTLGKIEADMCKIFVPTRKRQSRK